jgi:hypothetical protein
MMIEGRRRTARHRRVGRQNGGLVDDLGHHGLRQHDVGTALAAARPTNRASSPVLSSVSRIAAIGADQLERLVEDLGEL